MRTPLQIVEELVGLTGDDEGSLARFAPDVEVHPITCDRVLEGIDELRAYIAARDAEDRPQLQSCLVHEIDDRAVVLTTLAFQRTGEGGEKFTEVKPIGFVVTVREELVVRVEHFETWSAARHAAGLAEDAAPAKRVLLPRGLFSVAAPVRDTFEGLSRRLSPAR